MLSLVYAFIAPVVGSMESGMHHLVCRERRCLTSIPGAPDFQNDCKTIEYTPNLSCVAEHCAPGTPLFEGRREECCELCKDWDSQPAGCSALKGEACWSNTSCMRVKGKCYEWWAKEHQYCIDMPVQTDFYGCSRACDARGDDCITWGIYGNRNDCRLCIKPVCEVWRTNNNSNSCKEVESALVGAVHVSRSEMRSHPDPSTAGDILGGTGQDDADKPIIL